MAGLLALTAGGSHHEDDLVHFLLARSVAAAPANLLDPWGRPGCTAYYALPASLGGAETGWRCARLAALLGGLAVVALTAAAARRVRLPRPGLAAGFAATQPFLILLGATTLTELPAAVYLALALTAALRRRWVAAAGAVGLLLVTRHEAAVLLPLWAWRLRRAFRGGEIRPAGAAAALIALAAPPLLVNAVGRAVLGRWPWEVFLEPRPPGGGYGHGYPFTMLVQFAVAAGALTLLVAPLGWRRPRGGPDWGFVRGHVALLLLVHTLLYGAGLFGSAGYPRFFVVAATPTALLAAAGWERLRRCRRGGVAVPLAVWACLLGAAALLEMGRLRRLPGADFPFPPTVDRGLALGLAVLGVAAAGLARAGRYRRLLQGTLAVAALLQGTDLLYYGSGRPFLRRAPRAAALAALGGELRRRFPGAPLLTSSPWTALGADLPWRADRAPPWARIRAAPPGTLYVCDVGPRDRRRLLGAAPAGRLRADPAFRPLPGVRPPPGVAVLWKVR